LTYSTGKRNPFFKVQNIAHIYTMESLLSDLPDHVSGETLTEMLSTRINELISTDFSRLLTLLYRIDIDETQLRRVLRDHPDEDAGLIIARLILSREEEKAATRASFRKSDNDNDIPEDERW
jgi:hypothetical protein